MVRYSKEPDNATKAVKARGSHIRVHFKHTREIGEAIKGKTLSKARVYLENVLQFKEAIPFTKYTGGIGRHAIGKRYKAPGDKVAWPIKATRTYLDLLTNLEANATRKDLNADSVVITHVNANQAPKMRRRTYRAHGRINAYMSCPAHIEIIAEEPAEQVAKVEEPILKLNKKQAARQRKTVKIGGGI